MSRTVLQYVQKALNVCDSDAVDSISDTEESLQVADYLEEAYLELINREDWKFLEQPVTLTAFADLTQPTSFHIAEEIKSFKYIAYNVAEDGADAEYEQLTYLEPVEFVKRFSAPGSNRALVNVGDRVSFYVDTDKAPKYYTHFEGETDIVCNAYRSDIESTLVASKINGFAYVIPAFTQDDEFVPELPNSMIPLLQATLNAVCKQYLDDDVSPVDERRAGRGLAQARRVHSKSTTRKYYTRKYGRR